MATEDEVNEIGEEINLGEIESNLTSNFVLKPKEVGEPSRRNTNFVRPRHIQSGRTTNFSFGFIPRKTAIYEEIDLTPVPS